MGKTLKLDPITIVVKDVDGKVMRETTVGPFFFRKEWLDRKWYDPKQTACWRLTEKSSKKNRGHININVVNGVWCVSSTFLDHELRNLGFGKKMYQHLVDQVGRLQSDPDGKTSDQAQRVWRSLGARSFAQKDPYSGFVTRFELVSKINPPETQHQESLWMSFIFNMMNLSQQVKLIRLKFPSKIGLQTAFRKRRIG